MASRKYEQATARGKQMLASAPRAVGARYNRRADRVVITLSNGLDVSFSPRDAQGLEYASAADLGVIEIDPPGFGLHFPKLDADLYVPALLQGVLGSARWMAARTARGGKARIKAKAAAARRNGKRGRGPQKPSRAAAAPNRSAKRRKSNRRRKTA